jgi:dipeptidyl aminopeptidase/acylaminoacyl peptidase
MHAILQSDPPELPGTTLHASPALGRIIARCLQKDPADRFHSAHDLGLALESIAGGAGSGAAPVATAASRQPSGLSRMASWLAIAIAAGAIGALLHRHFATPTLADAVTMESLTYSGHDTSPAASPDGKTVAFTSDRDGVSRIWLKQIAGGGELALTTGSDDYPRFSPDGSSIIFVRATADGPSLYRVSLLGGDPRKLIDNVTGADWSPDGRELAFTRWVSGDRSDRSSASLRPTAAGSARSRSSLGVPHHAEMVAGSPTIAAVNGWPALLPASGWISSMSRIRSRLAPPGSA